MRFIELTDTLTGLSILMWVGLVCIYDEGLCNGINPPFPVIKYAFEYIDRTRRKKLCIMADLVDRIHEPAFVVPTKGGSEDFFLQDLQLMSMVTFYIPPYQFLLRDGYGDMDFEEQLVSCIRTDKRTRKYIRSTPSVRKGMYDELIETLNQNGDNPLMDDFDLLQAMNHH
jgi:hypothetical protein